jgi:hypothetical protein
MEWTRANRSSDRIEPPSDLFAGCVGLETGTQPPDGTCLWRVWWSSTRRGVREPEPEPRFAAGAVGTGWRHPVPDWELGQTTFTPWILALALAPGARMTPTRERANQPHGCERLKHAAGLVKG